MLPCPQLLIPTQIKLPSCQTLFKVLRRGALHCTVEVGSSHTPTVEKQTLQKALEGEVQVHSHDLAFPLLPPKILSSGGAERRAFLSGNVWVCCISQEVPALETGGLLFLMMVPNNRCCMPAS